MDSDTVVVVKAVFVLTGVIVVVPSTYQELVHALHSVTKVRFHTEIVLVDVMVLEGSVTVTVVRTGLGDAMLRQLQALVTAPWPFALAYLLKQAGRFNAA